MSLYNIIILALIQGITEFLPISSSGHLVLFHAATEGSAMANQMDQDLTMDIAVHIGTLASVLIYFYKDVLHMLCGLKDIATGKRDSQSAKLLLLVIIGSIPVIIAGLLLHFWDPVFLRSLYIIAATSIIFGVVLWHADRKAEQARSVDKMSIKDAVYIGLAQAIALIPGTSRSGITMTAARYLGFTRTEAAHYSLLLSMVAISGAGLITGLDLIKGGDAALTMDAAIAAVFSGISSYATIIVMMKFLRSFSFAPFAIYRVILGFVLFGLLYTGFIQ